MQPGYGVIVTLLALTAVPALAGSEGNESGQAERSDETRARQEAVAREHWMLYEQWVRESEKRDPALAREGVPAIPEAPIESESG